jgi:hypothetical protein
MAADSVAGICQSFFSFLPGPFGRCARAGAEGASFTLENISRLLFVIAAMFIGSSSIAGGGDLYCAGISKNKQVAFDLQEFQIEGASTHLVSVEIFPSKTSFSSGDRVPEPITGCAVVIAEAIPSALVCSSKTSNPAFRQVIYVFSGGGYHHKGSKFTCVHRCSQKIPQQFKLMESGTGEG